MSMNIILSDYDALKQIERLLDEFGVSRQDGSFKRSDSREIFVVIVAGMILRSDMDGVSSIVRALNLEPSHYESLVHAFHSEAWDLDQMRSSWAKYILDTDLPKRLNGKVIYLGDGCKQYHDGKYIVGVQKLHQESETQSKASYIYGHLYGGLSIVLEFEGKLYSMPLSLTIQNGIGATTDWEGSEHPYANESHVVQMLREAIRFSTFSNTGSLLIEDRYFMSQNSFKLLDEEYGIRDFSHGIPADRPVEMICCCKQNVHAYLDPIPHDKGMSGRKAMKGGDVYLRFLFNRKNLFTKATVKMYGEETEVYYCVRDLIWGAGYYQKIRFVLVYSKRGRMILASTSLNLSAEQIIMLYSLRFNIEEMFKDIKQDFAGFFGHFWTKSVPELNRFAPKGSPDPLLSIVDPVARRAILDNIHAMEAYALVASISMGICQMIAIKAPVGGRIQKFVFKRTYTDKKVSVDSVRAYLRDLITTLLLNGYSDSSLINSIRKFQARSKTSEVA